MLATPHNRPAFLPPDVVFESFTFPAFDLNYGADPAALAHAFHLQADPHPGQGRRGVYVHIPFCDTICLFCPFNKSVGTEERIETYFQALLKEIELGASTPLVRSWTVDAIYIGGGTPSVLGPERIFKLITTLKKYLTVASDVEVTLEVEPKSASEELLIAGHEAGATRVSFGVQTLDPALREMVNLTATLDQIHSTAELSQKHYANTNMDMIAGFPGQSTDAAVADMAAAAALGMGSISVYPMDYVAVLPKLLNRIRGGGLPSAPAGQDRWDIFHRARQALKEHYDVQNMYCFGRAGSDKCRYMFEILYGGYHDQAVGFGAGAYTMIRGLAYANIASETEYVATLADGRLPICRASPGHAYEKTFVYAPKRLSANLAEANELGIQDFILPKVNALESAGLVSVSGGIMTLTERGENEYAQMMVGFMSDQQRRLYDRACRRLAQDLNWDIDGPINDQRSIARGVGAASALPRQVART